MYSEINISDRAGIAVIDIEGVIGVPEKMQFESAGDRVATYERFMAALGSISGLDAPEVIVNIRSTGGDVNDALLIYETLSSLSARVVTRCYGYVASAATIIAQAASPGCREISSAALYLIHCSESVAEGNSGSMSRTKEMLDKTDGRIASIYALRSGKPEDDFAELMNENGGKGRWLSAHETVDAGLADKVIEPQAVINDAREAALMDALRTMASMAGITMAAGLEPLAAEEEKPIGKRPLIARLADRFREFIAGLFEEVPGGGEGRQEITPTPAPGSAPVNKVQLPTDNAVLLRLKEGQSGSSSTRTLQREDPSVGESRRNSNDAAYYEDAMSMRGRLER